MNHQLPSQTAPSAEGTSSDRMKVKNRLFNGRMTCWQYKHGYRYSIDSILLAHFPRVTKYERVLDLGSGCGIVGLLLLYRHRDLKPYLVGIEKQHDLAELARQNMRENGYEHSCSIIEGAVENVRQLVNPEYFSLVVSNPPFYSQGAGRQSEHHESREARHMNSEGLRDFVEAAAFALKNRGRAIFIYTADQVIDLLLLMQEKKIEPKRLQTVYSYPETQNAAKLILVEGCKNARRGVKILPPCYIYRHRQGPYSDQVQAMYGCHPGAA